jgi:hypothetical protein
MADLSIKTKTKKKTDAKKKTESGKRKEKEIKTDIFEEEYRFQWVNHH